MPPTPLLLTGLGMTGLGIAALGSPALAIPPPDDIPEEVLRTEVITEARSPIDGRALSPADYTVLQERLRDPNVDVVVNPELAQLIQLLQFRRILRPVIPFLP
ncbi:hypothetical protein [Leptolyngbya sp. KIOST-1]|uniref:hypothetical protein n=1 Tax=Leptolyngbya sp. KIOST-1 TaxID=1229172 RepID=UPI00056AE1B7|nr:hypothetical protein [Leptolyngbya sp. KIOST-1]